MRGRRRKKIEITEEEENAYFFRQDVTPDVKKMYFSSVGGNDATLSAATMPLAPANQKLTGSGEGAVG